MYIVVVDSNRDAAHELILLSFCKWPTVYFVLLMSLVIMVHAVPVGPLHGTRCSVGLHGTRCSVGLHGTRLATPFLSPLGGVAASGMQKGRRSSPSSAHHVQIRLPGL